MVSDIIFSVPVMIGFSGNMRCRVNVKGWVPLGAFSIFCSVEFIYLNGRRLLCKDLSFNDSIFQGVRFRSTESSGGIIVVSSRSFVDDESLHILFMGNSIAGEDIIFVLDGYCEKIGLPLFVYVIGVYDRIIVRGLIFVVDRVMVSIFVCRRRDIRKLIIRGSLFGVFIHEI